MGCVVYMHSTLGGDDEEVDIAAREIIKESLNLFDFSKLFPFKKVKFLISETLCTAAWIPGVESCCWNPKINKIVLLTIESIVSCKFVIWLDCLGLFSFANRFYSTFFLRESQKSLIISLETHFISIWLHPATNAKCHHGNSKFKQKRKFDCLYEQN